MNRYGLLVFTDMDGSLLDHHTYSHASADATLELLKEQNVPVIANTSKTRAELEQLRLELNNSHPFIAENGAAVYLPKNPFHIQPENTVSDGEYWVKSFVKPRSYWQNLIDEIAPNYENDFITFAQAGIEGIVEYTNLPLEKAKLAADREFGEPVKWLGSIEQKQSFFADLGAKGANILHGGRFSHVSGQCDKGKAMNWLKTQYEMQLNDSNELKTVALGDSQNDAAMLDAADFAVIIKSPENSAPVLLSEKEKTTNKTLLYSSECGPEGWVQGINYVLGVLNDAK